MTNRQSAMRANAASKLRVLLIAPTVDLPKAAEEQQRITNRLHPEVLIGDVGIGDILDATQDNVFDVVWFLGHSGPEGLQLTEGLLSPAHFSQILRSNPPSLVVLNSCSSLNVANQIHDELQCAVICTVLDVPDVDAFITGSMLAQALAQGQSVAHAYQASRPSSNRQYVMLNGSVRLNGDTELDDMRRLILRTHTDMQREIAGLMREMVIAQKQRDEMNHALTAVQTEQSAVRTELAATRTAYHVRLTRPHALAWTGGFALAVAAGVIIGLRDQLGLSIPASLGFGLFVCVVSLGLFVWGLQFRFDSR